MPIFKNPFSKEKGSEQLTPDLLTSEKIEEAQEEIKKDLEKEKEKVKEEVEKGIEEKVEPREGEKPSLKVPARPGLAKAVPAKSINLQKVEKIMQEDLEEIYFNMDEAHRRLFKAEGERTARQIERVIQTGKSVVVKVLELLKRWLQFIPGVNKFFIEQEAKIKTDKILKIMGEGNK